VSARTLLVLLLAAGAAAIAAAQFDFLKQAVDKLKTGNTPAPTQQQSDTVSAVGQIFKGAAGIGPKEEHDIGDSVALEIVGKYGGLVRDAAALHRVNVIGRTLARYSDRPELNWRFGVLNSESVNAFSAPDGWVFITHGLYSLARNDDALAGILGHEIAHVTGRHALKIVEGTTFMSGLAGLAAARSSDVRAVDSQLQQFDLGIGKIASSILEKGYSPETEYEADRNGRHLAQITGYAPGGLRGVLTYLQQHGGDSKATFSTHPPLRDRLKRLPDEPAPKI